MKKCLYLLGLTTLSASAVTTISVSNLDTTDTSDSAIFDSEGNVIQIGEGSIQVGYFDTFTTSEDFSGSTSSSLLDDFVAFGSTTSAFDNSFNVDGFFSADFIDTINTGDVIIGQTLFTVIGNNNTLSNSTDFLVFRHDGTEFAEEVAGIGAASGVVRVGSGTLLLGTNTGDTIVNGFAVGSFTQIALPVPEPSSTLLIGLAGIGMTLRRRR